MIAPAPAFAVDLNRLLGRGDAQGAAALLDRAAQAGDAQACLALAQWLVAGAPIARDLPRARDLLRRGAGLAHPQCALMEMAFLANGSGGPADWAGALALLRGFAAHDAYGARLLAMVERMDLDEAGAPRALPQAQPLDGGPRAFTLPGLLDEEECTHLCRIAQASLQPAHIIDAASGRKVPHPVRDSAAATLGPPQEDLVVRALLVRIAAASATPVAHGEPLNVLRYAPGQQYRAHLDTLPPPHSQRVRTVIVYLNEDYEGGETRFEPGGPAVRGRTGDALVFDNVLPDGRVDPAARHAGLPVRAGEKWVATRWIRARPFSAWTGA